MTAENKTDLQDLIHENMMRAYEKGQQTERERVIKLLDELDDEEWMGINQNFIALIKGEQK